MRWLLVILLYIYSIVELNKYDYNKYYQKVNKTVKQNKYCLESYKNAKYKRGAFDTINMIFDCSGFMKYLDNRLPLGSNNQYNYISKNNIGSYIFYIKNKEIYHIAKVVSIGHYIKYIHCNRKGVTMDSVLFSKYKLVKR